MYGNINAAKGLGARDINRAEWMVFERYGNLEYTSALLHIFAKLEDIDESNALRKAIFSYSKSDIY